MRDMVMRNLVSVVALSVLVALAVIGSSAAFEMSPYQMVDDLEVEPPLHQAALQYYYYIPTPDYSWFWGCYLEPGDILGVLFWYGDIPQGGLTPCGVPWELESIRFLDFVGYGHVYPGWYTVEFDVYRADENGSPLSPSLWNSGPVEPFPGWNQVAVSPPVRFCDWPSDNAAFPVLITATHTGTEIGSPMWGFDNISSPAQLGVNMHDVGCFPALYPRPGTGHYTSMHTGYYGNGSFSYVPPIHFPDGRDSSADGSNYGFVEAAWRIYATCGWPG